MPIQNQPGKHDSYGGEVIVAIAVVRDQGMAGSVQNDPLFANLCKTTGAARQCKATPGSGRCYGKLQDTVTPAMVMATILISLTRMLRLGPAVSFKGSPTVSPITAAWWALEFLPPW
jgi:hypothetical protein